MLTYMLDTNICIHVLAEQLCISSITLSELFSSANSPMANSTGLHRLNGPRTLNKCVVQRPFR
jgi:predicted nucleic acid-binding protein